MDSKDDKQVKTTLHILEPAVLAGGCCDNALKWTLPRMFRYFEGGSICVLFLQALTGSCKYNVLMDSLIMSVILLSFCRVFVSTIICQKHL